MAPVACVDAAAFEAYALDLQQSIIADAEALEQRLCSSSSTSTAAPTFHTDRWVRFGDARQTLFAACRALSRKNLAAQPK